MNAVHPSTHLYLLKKLHVTHHKTIRIELDEKGHSTATLTFAHELHKRNITNDKIQNQ